jgi:hypothetical protein
MADEHRHRQAVGHVLDFAVDGERHAPYGGALARGCQ